MSTQVCRFCIAGHHDAHDASGWCHCPRFACKKQTRFLRRVFPIAFIVVFAAGCITPEMETVTQSHVYDVNVGDCVTLPDAGVFVVQGDESLHIFTADPGTFDCTNAQAVAIHDQRARDERQTVESTKEPVE